MNEISCHGCAATNKGDKKQFWHLQDYYGITGLFCNNCYNKVAHTLYGGPKHPQAYRNMVKRLREREENEIHK